MQEDRRATAAFGIEEKKKCLFLSSSAHSVDTYLNTCASEATMPTGLPALSAGPMARKSSYQPFLPCHLPRDLAASRLPRVCLRVVLPEHLDCSRVLQLQACEAPRGPRGHQGINDSRGFPAGKVRMPWHNTQRKL